MGLVLGTRGGVDALDHRRLRAGEGRLRPLHLWAIVVRAPPSALLLYDTQRHEAKLTRILYFLTACEIWSIACYTSEERPLTFLGAKLEYDLRMHSAGGGGYR